MLRKLALLAFASMLCCTKRSDELPSNKAAALSAGSGNMPIEKNGHYIFSSGDLAVEIDPRVGGRVVSISLGGRNFLTGTDVDPNNYGSTFWTSPQSDWGWPPPPEIDNLPYASAISGKNLVLSGSNSPKLGVSVTKTFSLDAATSSMAIRYAVSNHGAASVTLAPWEITRVHTGGTTFFPTGTKIYDYGNKSLVTSQAAGMTWFKYDAATITTDCKLFADAGSGLLAHVDGDVALVKKFPDVAPDQQAPKEAEIEIYANAGHTYVEIENQGSYTPVAPNSSAEWTVRWSLRRLPANIDASVGSAALVAWVKRVASEL